MTNTKPIFSAKARALASLAGKVKSAQVLPLEMFTVAEWMDDKELTLKNRGVE